MPRGSPFDTDEANLGRVDLAVDPYRFFLSYVRKFL
jgi:hypothetical protein